MRWTVRYKRYESFNKMVTDHETKEIMMVDFDAAVAAVQNRTRSRVPGENRVRNPEFGANVVANPQTYPGLKRWVAEFGDERARQQLVAMGWPVPQNGVQPQPVAEPTAQWPEQQVSRNSSISQQYQPEQPVNQQYGRDAAYAASSELRPVCRPIHESRRFVEVADYSSSQPRNEPEQQYAEQQYAAAQESPADAGFTAELAMTTTDQMLMARIASEAPDFVRVLRAIRTSIPELLAWPPVERFGHQRGHSSAPAVS